SSRAASKDRSGPCSLRATSRNTGATSLMPVHHGPEEDAERARIPVQHVVPPQVRLRLVLDLEADPRAHLVAARIVALRREHVVLLDLAHRMVSAQDADAARVPD